MITRLRIGRLAILALLALGAAGCGVYSASKGRVADSIQRVAVRTLESTVAEPNLDVDLTEAIIDAIQADNTLKIVDEEFADSVIFGSVIGYRVREVATRPDLTVNEYQVQIAVTLTFEVIETGERIFDKRRFNGTGRYILDDPEGGNETTARDEATTEIVTDILAQVVEDW